jgi:hypothetical protein
MSNLTSANRHCANRAICFHDGISQLSRILLYLESKEAISEPAPKLIIQFTPEGADNE